MQNNALKLTVKQILFFLIFVSIFSVYGQKKKDIESIKKMCGCFEIEFNFAETFSHSDDSLYKKSKNYNSKALEYAKLIKDEKDHISIQHLLVMKDNVIKHWRQDWIYENQNFYAYDGKNTWKPFSKDKKEVNGQWTQEVFQVDDSPRYFGSSSWVHVDGKSYWENTSHAPLPRREYTKRDDYDIMIRGNRHEIVSDGWIHDQDNKKIIKKSTSEEVILAEEKGFNKYTRVDDSKCAVAIEWWDSHYEKWSKVRGIWNSIYEKNEKISLKKTIDDKPLFSYMFDDKLTDEKEIGLIIDQFLSK